MSEYEQSNAEGRGLEHLEVLLSRVTLSIWSRKPSTQCNIVVNPCLIMTLAMYLQHCLTFGGSIRDYIITLRYKLIQLFCGQASGVYTIVYAYHYYQEASMICVWLLEGMVVMQYSSILKCS